MKVLSLFSGVGGFDLGLENAGMETVAMCEWDKKAASVLRRHWPHIPIYGDVSDLTGAQLVADGVMPDLVAFGSPCQDLSVAGKRAGLSGERSGLFHEAIRIIRELRELSDGTLPRWVIWENVVGALNSNGGQDFQAVLDQMADLGACFSEWGVMDAQNYGVAQRRRRIFLVACLDPRTAQQCPDPLLPLGQGRPRDLEPIREAWKGSPRGLEERSPRHHRREFIFQPGGVVRLGGHFAEDGVVPTLRAEAKRGDMEPHVLIAGIDDRRGGFREFGDVSDTLQAFMGTGGGNVPIVIDEPIPLDLRNATRRPDGPQGVGIGNEGDPSPTLTTVFPPGVAQPFTKSRRAQSPDDHETWVEGDVSPTLNLFDNGGESRATVLIPYTDIVGTLTVSGLQKGQTNTADNGGLQVYGIAGDEGEHRATIRVSGVRESSFGGYTDSDISGTLKQSGGALSGGSETFAVYGIAGNVIGRQDHNGGNGPGFTPEGGPMYTLTTLDIHAVATSYAVRRLLPIECERLMGWPDDWTRWDADGKEQADSHRYKQTGNGVASPVSEWVGRQIFAADARRNS